MKQLKCLAFASLFFGYFAFAGTGKISFEFKDADINKVVEVFSETFNKRVVVDPGVKGKITIFSPGAVSEEEAFNLLSEALSLNGYAIGVRSGVWIIRSARNIQRDWIPVVNELPPLRPERMVTYVVQLNHVSADEVNMNLRILPSKDGEMVIGGEKKLVITDWVSNLHRVKRILNQVDTANNNFYQRKHSKSKIK